MKNDLSTDKILKRVLFLLVNYEATNLGLNRYTEFRVTCSFVSTSREMFFIYNRRFLLQKETREVMTHTGWETLLEGLEKDLGKLTQVTCVESHTNSLLVFTDIDVTEIIGVLKQV